MIVLHDEQGSDAWLQSRVGVITASEFATAVSTTGGLTEQQATYVRAIRDGMDEPEARALAGYRSKPSAEAIARALAGLPFGEPGIESQRLAVRKAIERISGRPYGITGSFFATERGHEGEGCARLRYEYRRQGVMVEEAGLILTDDRKFGASLDGMVGDDGTIEVKVPLDPLKVIHILRTGDVSEYMHQMQGGLWITGRAWCDFLMGVPDLACLDNGNELYVQRVQRNDDFIDAMVDQLWQFELRVQRFEQLMRTPYSSG